jgi:Fic family protein
MPISYKWRPVSDLPDHHGEWYDSEIHVLRGVWREQKDSLEQSGALEQFNERLQRQWAIETGIIEHVYTLDRGITLLLIEQGIVASLIPSAATDRHPELVARIMQDHEEAIEGLFDFVKGNRVLSTGYIKELHALLTRHQETATAVDQFGKMFEVPLLRGAYKHQPNNPLRPDGTVHEYCPPEHVASEMDRLIELHSEHQKKGTPAEIEAAWLHHAFTQIHPFQDGNGRVVRALATLVFIQAEYFPLTITRDDRSEYIAALEEADAGSLQRLVKLFARIQRTTFVSALGIAGQVREAHAADQIIGAARDTLEKRRQALRQELERAKQTARELQDVANERLQSLATQLGTEIGVLHPQYRFTFENERDGGERRHYFRQQIIETAKQLGYFANTSEYHDWSRLVLRAEGQAELLLSIHGIGREYRGVLAASLCFFRREETASGERQVGEVRNVSGEVFQINYREDPAAVRARFVEWLERGIVRALELWKSGL